jgi:hypothetical protein
VALFVEGPTEVVSPAERSGTLIEPASKNKYCFDMGDIVRTYGRIQSIHSAPGASVPRKWLSMNLPRTLHTA